MTKFDGTKIVMGALSIIVGLVLFPVIGAFSYNASHSWNGTAWVDNTNITGVSGLTALIDLVMYGFAFGLVGLGVGLIYLGSKG